MCSCQVQKTAGAFILILFLCLSFLEIINKKGFKSCLPNTVMLVASSLHINQYLTIAVIVITVFKLIFSMYNLAFYVYFLCITPRDKPNR